MSDDNKGAFQTAVEESQGAINGSVMGGAVSGSAGRLLNALRNRFSGGD